jgi:phosphoglucomutase
LRLAVVIAKCCRGRRLGASTIRLVDDFSYTDPVDHRVTSHQGIRLLLDDGSRIVYRLSGTGSGTATLRIYLERYEPDAGRHCYRRNQTDPVGNS